MPLGVSDDSHGPDHQQLPQIAVTLLGDAAQLLLAAAGVLPRDKADPGGQIPAGSERGGSGTVATIALASTGPTPGTSISRQPNSVDLALALTRRSFSSTWHSPAQIGDQRCQ